jgi:hypothetical protein
MKKELTYYFVFSICVGSIIYICEKTEIILPKIIRFYVNDFLIIPIVLYISLFVVRKLKGKVDLQLSLLNIIYLCTLYSVIFEYWLPKFHSRYTSDFVDVGLYFLSGMVFYFLQKEKKHNEVSRSN